jgi:aspartate/methionine/tyrosine aminotransferase
MSRNYNRRMPRVRSVIHHSVLPPFDPLNARAAELRAAGHDVISLGQAIPYFPPPRSAVAAARAALDTPEVHRYVTDPGSPALRKALADRLTPMTSDRGTSLTPADLLITAGANHAFSLIVATLVDPGDEVIVQAPYFTNHYGAIVAAGAVPVEAPIADRRTFALRWSDIEPHVTSKTRVVVLCSPSNPTGAPVEPADGEQIVSELARRGVTVISDETYMHFVYEGAAEAEVHRPPSLLRSHGEPRQAHWSAASVPGWRDNVVVIGTFSKSFGMMGWRVGFVLADAAVCAEAVKVQDAVIICAPVISQMAATAAVRDDWNHALTFHDELRARRRILADGLAAIPRVSWVPTRGGLFAFARVDGCDDSARLAHDLLEQAHVVTIPGAAFGGHGEGHLRISYGYATQDELSAAVDRIGAFLANY